MLEKRDRLLVARNGARGHDAGRSVTGVCANDGLERFACAVHEIRIVAAVHVKVDVARRDEISPHVERRTRPRGQIFLLADCRHPPVRDLDDAIGDEAVGQNQCRVDDPN
jgi:hypothetical protein